MEKKPKTLQIWLLELLVLQSPWLACTLQQSHQTFVFMNTAWPLRLPCCRLPETPALQPYLETTSLSTLKKVPGIKTQFHPPLITNGVRPWNPSLQLVPAIGETSRFSSRSTIQAITILNIHNTGPSLSSHTAPFFTETVLVFKILEPFCQCSRCVCNQLIPCGTNPEKLLSVLTPAKPESRRWLITEEVLTWHTEKILLQP